MISVCDVKKSAVRSHYDLVTPFYRLLWGEHIHHGLWHAGCRVTGMTLSPPQWMWADANRIGFAPQSFDVVCSIECSNTCSTNKPFFAARQAGCALVAYRSGAMRYFCFVFQAAPVERGVVSHIHLSDPTVAEFGK
ncbi:MAG: hypothetical protein JSS27_06440 [Planctomycetes bacterium]|nr:hypothetical protein [Planctomycetota bacterium]